MKPDRLDYRSDPSDPGGPYSGFLWTLALVNVGWMVFVMLSILFTE